MAHEALRQREGARPAGQGAALCGVGTPRDRRAPGAACAGASGQPAPYGPEHPLDAVARGPRVLCHPGRHTHRAGDAVADTDGRTVHAGAVRAGRALRGRRVDRPGAAYEEQRAVSHPPVR